MGSARNGDTAIAEWEEFHSKWKEDQPSLHWKAELKTPKCRGCFNATRLASWIYSRPGGNGRELALPSTLSRDLGTGSLLWEGDPLPFSQGASGLRGGRGRRRRGFLASPAESVFPEAGNQSSLSVPLSDGQNLLPTSPLTLAGAPRPSLPSEQGLRGRAVPAGGSPRVTLPAVPTGCGLCSRRDSGWGWPACAHPRARVPAAGWGGGPQGSADSGLWPARVQQCAGGAASCSWLLGELARACLKSGAP